MSPENTPQTTKICPTCGTRLGINATRCSVCGSNLAPSVAVASNKAISGPRIPEVTLSLPLVFGLAVLLLVIGAGVVFAVLKAMGEKAPLTAAAAATITPTRTATGTATLTPTTTSTGTPIPTLTPEPPVEYKVAASDTCLGIALTYNVTVNSIEQLNGSSCNILTVGQTLKIPRPSPTPQPSLTSTPNATERAIQECETVDYVVKDGDTLGGIAGAYAVSQESVRVYNNLPSDVVISGQKLIIPKCEQILETRTPTPIPPYGAPDLLLPADGTAFTSPSDVITLQWSSVGELRQSELYAITIEDVTAGEARKWTDYRSDQKFIVPQEYRPTDNTPHVYRWTVLSVRQTSTDKATGAPVYEPAGAVSVQRVFTWVGGGPIAPTTPPEPTGTPTP